MTSNTAQNNRQAVLAAADIAELETESRRLEATVTAEKKLLFALFTESQQLTERILAVRSRLSEAEVRDAKAYSYLHYLNESR